MGRCLAKDPEERWQNARDVMYSRAGYLLFIRGTTLFAAPFDLTRGTATADPVPVVENVSRALTNATFSASDRGVESRTPSALTVIVNWTRTLGDQ